VRYGDTLETIAFDWKISPQDIVNANRISSDLQLVPGQTIILPALAGL
jgi:spore germination protein YaaH